MVLELEASQAQVQKVVQSKAFRTSEVHRNLLNYLAEKSLAGESDSLKEYTVGLDVFGKPSSYDPRQESTVRMHVARLRQKLAEYYRTEGVEDAVVIDLPKGGFRVTFEGRPALEPPAVAAETAPPVFPHDSSTFRRSDANAALPLRLDSASLPPGWAQFQLEWTAVRAV